MKSKNFNVYKFFFFVIFYLIFFFMTSIAQPLSEPTEEDIRDCVGSSFANIITGEKEYIEKFFSVDGSLQHNLNLRKFLYEFNKLSKKDKETFHDNHIDFMNKAGLKHSCFKTKKGKEKEEVRNFLDSFCENGAHDIVQKNESTGVEETIRVCKNATGNNETLPKNDSTKDVNNPTPQQNNPTPEEMASCIIGSKDQIESFAKQQIVSGGDLSEILSLATEVQNYVDNKNNFSDEKAKKLNNDIINWMDKNNINHNCQKVKVKDTDPPKNNDKEEEKNPTPEEMASCIIGSKDQIESFAKQQIVSGGDLSEILSLATEVQNYVDNKNNFSDEKAKKLNNDIINWMDKNNINHNCQKVKVKDTDPPKNNDKEEEKNPTPEEMASCIIGSKDQISKVVNDQILNETYDTDEFKLATRILSYAKKGNISLSELKDLNNDIIDWMDKNKINHNCKKTIVKKDDEDEEIILGCKFGTREVTKVDNGVFTKIKVCKSGPNEKEDPGICLD